MPRKYRPPATSTSDRMRVNRASAAVVEETGDAEKDGPLWMSRLMKTLHMRMESDNGDRHWAAYRNWFNGKQWQFEDTGKNSWDLYSDTITSVYTNNIVQTIASAYMPFLLNGKIEFKVKAKPNRPGDVNAAEIHTSMLNYEWAEREMTEQVKKVVDDVVVIGHGIAETAYVVEVDEARRKSSGNIEYRDYVKRDAAIVEWVDPHDFLHDLTGRDGTPRTGRWAARRSWIPIANVVANKRYDPNVTRLIESGAASHNLTSRSAYRNDARFSAGGMFGKDLAVRIPEESSIAIWEIWDKGYRQVMTMAEGLPYPLDVEPWRYPYLDGLPFVMIQFLRAEGLLYPIGVARQLKDPQLQTNRVRTQQIQDVRARKAMYGRDVNKVSETAVTDFANLPNLSVIPMQGDRGIFPIENPPFNREALILEQAIAQDAQKATGADAIFQGETPSARTPAGVVTTQVNVMRLKADDKISNVEGGVNEIARQILQHLKANRVQSDVIEIVGLLGSQWREYSHAEIQAETDVTVSYFSAPKTNPDIERQQKTQVAQVAAQFDPLMAQSGSPVRINFVELFAWLLKSFPDYQDVGRFFTPALSVQPELQQTLAPAGAGAGMPPALAGQLAPQQIPGQPGVENPGEGFSEQDVLMQILGSSSQIQ
jgi:hypothetical protein